MPGGFAIPHPRQHDSYLFESSFIVVGRSLQPINFGSPDGRPTKLFFLVCCQDDRLHLHTLARLCFLIQKTNLLVQIDAAPDPDSIFNSLIVAESEAISDRR
jgi:mannitol/fructose-specific phosphotransferase system IIA component (Ntr-type)